MPYDFSRAGQSEGDESLELSGVADVPPSEQFAAVAKEHFYHMHYFQAVGPAEAELCPRPQDLLSRWYWALSAEGNLLDWRNHPSEGTGYLDVLEEPKRALPWGWMSEADLDYIVDEYERNGVAHRIQFSAPFIAWRRIEVAANHAAQEWARGVRKLVEEDFSDGKRITLVMDNLSTHTGASLYKAFEPQVARRL